MLGCVFDIALCVIRAVARALIGGGGEYIHTCSARLISFEINLKTADSKRNSSGITRIYEYTPPPPISVRHLSQPYNKY